MRIYFLQQWYDMSDPSMEHELKDHVTFRVFARVRMDHVPDETTICKFRHLLEAHVGTDPDGVVYSASFTAANVHDYDRDGSLSAWGGAGGVWGQGVCQVGTPGESGSGRGEMEGVTQGGSGASLERRRCNL